MGNIEMERMRGGGDREREVGLSVCLSVSSSPILHFPLLHYHPPRCHFCNSCVFDFLWGFIRKKLILRKSSGAGPATQMGPQSSGSLAKLSSVFFVDRDQGWVAGANGTLLATENGGAKWSRKTLPEQKRNEALNDLWLFNPERGMLLGEYGMFNRRVGVIEV